MSVLSRFLRRPAAAGTDPEIQVEPMRRRDVTDIEPIELASYPRPWSMTIFQSEMELARRGERTYIVARRATELVGYAGQMYVAGEAHVTNIATSPASRRSGVATRLLAELTWAAIEHGCTAMTLEVRVSNNGAQALYRRFGFAPVGIRQKYYENVEDAIVMWCHDIALPEHRDRISALSPEAARG